MAPICGRRGGRAPRNLAPGAYGLEPASLGGPVTSRSLFGNEAPLELEVGSGKGSFLVAESMRRPEVNFLGIEYARRYWRYAADRLRRNECANARIVLAEAEGFLRDFVPPSSLSGIHVYFPDPWPKTRHRKRRFLKLPLLELLSSRMLAGARVSIVTDHGEYFEEIVEAIERSSLAPVPFEPPAEAAGELVGSNFERKYAAEGRRLYAIAAVKAR